MMPDIVDEIGSLRGALSLFATGVAVVVGQHEKDGLVAATINSFASVSLSPPLVLFSYAKSSSRHDRIVGLNQYSINVLRADQHDIASAFAGNDVDRWRSFVDPCFSVPPRLKHALATFQCTRYAAHDGGDHTILLSRITRFDMDRSGRALVFFNRDYCALPA
ncbi:flavin reductase [Burkholderia cenocepacia]|jgi:flavin reductase (DIM6/NTAB) family NADH-FMN oxidoreductase RutF|uniref:flavin reductase family protein n=1 Tax=Burkholderia cenocepacia TaxID=95486 RepID=UPI000D69B99C|nr:flavin reductase family protein [Burkholderia cenocepacia]RQU98665.1 flavin reductase [Burkholderia cenocepacia]HDR9880352.1 flavin reductase [Burkholderia cenocepacia]HDR9887643.1 flavin reductase [Burkholderia cenocepacia]